MDDKNLLLESCRLGIARQTFPHHAVPESPCGPCIVPITAVAAA